MNKEFIEQYIQYIQYIYIEIEIGEGIKKIQDTLHYTKNL